MNRVPDHMKQGCQHGRVSFRVRNLATPPENAMPTKHTNLPTGLRQRRGSGSWFQVFNDKHRQPKQKWVRLSASTRSRAEIERGRLIADYEAGAFDPWQVEVEAEVVSLQSAFAEYLESKSGLAPNSIISKKQAISLFLASIPTKAIPAQVEVKDFRRHFARSSLKPSSKKTRLAELSNFFKWCQKQGYALKNPAKLYKEDQAENLSRYERNRARREGALPGAIMPKAFRVLTGHISMQAATDTATKQPRHDLMRDIVTFALATGLRRSELAHLRRQDVTLGPVVGRWPDTGTLDVQCWEDPATGHRFRTKNGVDRKLRLVPVAAQIAARHLSTSETEDEYAPLFRSMRGVRLYAASLTSWFGEYRTAAGLPERTTLHSLRHSFASYLLMLGVDVLKIQAYLGHASLSQMEHYGKAAEDYLLGDAQKMRREILKLFCPDLSPATVEVLLPGRSSFFETLRTGHRLRLVVPIDDALFEGVAGEVERELARRAETNETGMDLHDYSDLIKTT